MTKPSLAIISFSAIASDARLLKQIAALRGDYHLTILGYGPRPDGVDEFISIPDELVYWKYNRAAVIVRAYRFAYWRSPVVAFARRALSNRRFDVVLGNDVDSAGLALSLRPRGGVHLDLHEYAPRQKEEVPRWRRFVAPFMRWMCRRYVARAASVTTVGQGIADEYAREFGFTPRVVTNAAPFADLPPQPVGPTIRLVHSGACLRDRGINEIIEAAIATRSEVSLDLYLMPNDPSYLEELRGRAEHEPRVTLHPSVPYRELAATLNRYDVGVHVLPPVSFNNAWALPNKFFDYVQARLGVIVGPSPEMQRIIGERRLGAVAAGFTAADLTDVLDALDTKRVDVWKHASHEAARALSSERQVDVWRDAIAALSARARLAR
ncbi:glycosyltransferase [Agromyces bauzanensis]